MSSHQIIKKFCKNLKDRLQKEKGFLKLTSKAIDERIDQFLFPTLILLDRHNLAKETIEVLSQLVPNYLHTRSFASSKSPLSIERENRQKAGYRAIDSLLALEDADSFFAEGMRKAIHTLQNIIFHDDSENFLEACTPLQKLFFKVRLDDFSKNSKKCIESLKTEIQKRVFVNDVLQPVFLIFLKKLKGELDSRSILLKAISTYSKGEIQSPKSNKPSRKFWMQSMSQLDQKLMNLKVKPPIRADWIAKIFYGVGLEKHYSPREIGRALGKVRVMRKKKIP